MQLEKATDLVCQHWFPYDAGVYRQAIACLADHNSEDEDVCKKNLLPLLRTDASLYFLCLKEVQKNVKRVRLEETAYLRSILESASLSEINTALHNISRICIPHDFHALSDIQSARLSEMLVASNTAEMLSTVYSVSNDVGYSAALVRQIGYTLIAWNYPQIYKRITESPSTKTEIDLETRRYLGFTPTMLAMSVLKKFGLDAEFSDIVSDYAHVSGEAIANIQKICEVGEALARATNPEIYSTARADFSYAEEFLSRVCGTEALLQIITKSSAAPIVETSSFSVDMLEKGIVRSQHARALRDRNVYLSALPEKERHVAQKVYAYIEPDSPSKEALRVYAKELIPESLFRSTVVYLIDPIEESLYPSLILGSPRVLVPRMVSLKRPGSHELLVSSLKLVSPIVEEQAIGNLNSKIVVSSMGDPIVGVFYVEMIDEDNQLNINRYFKALRNVLIDSLAI